MLGGQRLQPRDRLLGDAPELLDRRRLVLRQSLDQLSVELARGTRRSPGAGSRRRSQWFSHSSAVRFSGGFPSRRIALDFSVDGQALALVEDRAELDPAVEHPLAAGTGGFEPADDGPGVIEDIEGSGGRGLPAREQGFEDLALKLSVPDPLRSLKSRRPSAAASSC